MTTLGTLNTRKEISCQSHSFANLQSLGQFEKSLVLFLDQDALR